MPIANQFNYMVLQITVEDETVLIDARDKHRPYNVLPERAMNGEGLVLNPYGPQWIDLRMNKEINSKTVVGDFVFNDDMELTGSMEIDFKSVASSRLRASLYEEIEKEGEPEEEEEENESLDDYKTGEVENTEVINLKDPMQNLKVKYDFTLNEGINVIGDKIFMSPVILKYISENLFKLEERLYPVEISSPISDTYVFKIAVPEGYEIEELPKAQVISLPNRGGKYMYNAGQVGESIQVMVRLTLSQTQYSADSYGSLKELFNIILSKQDQQIVFKEKSE